MSDTREYVCGEDFCDACGDCLACYYDDPCYDSADGKHVFVDYEAKEDTGGE